jgi:hypothetical protein
MCAMLCWRKSRTKQKRSNLRGPIEQIRNARVVRIGVVIGGEVMNTGVLSDHGKDVKRACGLRFGACLCIWSQHVAQTI